MSKRKTSVAVELRKAIRAAERRGQTQYAIAKAAGVSPSVLARIARGENLPRLDTAERIAAAIGQRLTLLPN
ncbi:MAG: helix-turn-helix transcriptional regulator [Gemmataceae bacterium]|nr:helix-turn-helix transcriptional regulator [Gemmataceae bacterium]